VAAVASVTHALVGQSERRSLAHFEQIEKFGHGLQDLRAECHATLTAMRVDPQRAQLFGEYLNAIHGEAEAIRKNLLEEAAQLEKNLQASYRRLLDYGLPMIISQEPIAPPPAMVDPRDPRFGREMFGPPPEARPQAAPRRAPAQPRVIQGSPPPMPARAPAPRPEPKPEGVTLPPAAAFSAFARPAAKRPAAPAEKAKANGPAAPTAPPESAESEKNDGPSPS
jgi:hypothetical protein